MQIKENKFVSLTYELKVDGNIVDQSDAAHPMEFVFGAGNGLLPKFESKIEGKVAGNTFDFLLSAADGYGEHIPEAVAEVPLNKIIEDEKKESMLIVGHYIILHDIYGNDLPGCVKEIKTDSVIIDFNHPLVGCELHFTGTILTVRDATEKEIADAHNDCDDDCDDCGCGCQSCS